MAHLVKDATRALVRSLQTRLAEHGVPFGHWAFLRILWERYGLTQRDRDFSHYQDEDAHYQRRPSYWVAPLGDWSKGTVELVEIPNDEDIHDNIVSYWIPSMHLQPHKPYTFSYLLSAYSSAPQL